MKGRPEIRTKQSAAFTGRRFWCAMLLACAMALSWPIAWHETAAAGDQSSFAVDQTAYVARVKAAVARLLKDRMFYCKVGTEDRCRELMEKLRAGDFQVVPPFEWSDDDPDLPTYLEIRKACPKFDFEFDHSSIGLLRATENFALYRLPAGAVSSGDDGSLFAMRLERFILQNADWGRRRLHRSRQMSYAGGFHFINVSTCEEFNATPSHREGAASLADTVNEIVMIDGRLHVLSIYPYLTGTPPDYGIAIYDLGRDGRSRTNYLLSTVQPSRRKGNTP